MTRSEASSMFVRIAERLGVPTAILVALGWACWHFGNRALDEVAVPMTKRHIEFVDEVSITNKAVSEATAKNAETQNKYPKACESSAGCWKNTTSTRATGRLSRKHRESTYQPPASRWWPVSCGLAASRLSRDGGAAD